jgi:thioredoxin-related protein
MKKLLYTTILILLAYILSLAQGIGEGNADNLSTDKTGGVDSTKIVWLKYDDGLKLAKESGKHVFIDFFTDWCYYCKKMDKDIFSQTEVIKMLNKDFVCVKVDGESKKELDIDGYKITERNLARSEYRVRGYPAYWFLKPDGDRLGTLPGYQKLDVFKDVLYFMKEGLYENMKFNEYMKNGGRKALDKG